MTRPGARYLPHLTLTLLIAIWAVSFVVAKVAMRSVSPPALVAARFLLASCCVLPFALGGLRRDGRRTLLPGVLAGTVLAAGYFLQMWGVRETTASMGGFLTGLIVLLVALGGRLFFHARFGPRAVVGLLLGIVGIGLLCLPDAGGDGDGGPAAVNTLRGILLQVGSAVAFAGHVLLLTHYGRRLPIAPFMLWQLAFITGLGVVVTALHGSVSADGGPLVWTADPLLAIGYLGVLATAFAISVQAKVQAHIPPMHTALLFALQPLFAALAGWLLQGDRLGPMQWAGGALVIAGVVVTSFDR